MTQIILAFILIIAAIFLPQFIPKEKKIRLKGADEEDQIVSLSLLRGAVSIGLILLSVFLFANTSFVIIGQYSVGHLKRIYLAADLPPGKIIATDGQKGSQADILGPGFHFSLFLKVLNDVEEFPVTEVKEGHYGILIAKDGTALREGQFIADAWGDSQFDDMLNAKHFLTTGKGQKGPQLDVLRPGKYRLNSYLFKVRAAKALDVRTGHVAVIRSNVQTLEACPNAEAFLDSSEGKTNSDLSAPLVPKGCIGVWDKPLLPGRYYLNEQAYVATVIPTRVSIWTYIGGYTARQINLTVGDNGKISQEATSFQVPKPQNAADKAINVRVEGWTIPVDMRVIVQVHPKDAPRVVASVGDLQRVEDNIVTPAIRDMLRTIGGQQDRKVLDFVEKREEIVALVEKAIAPEAAKAGVTIQEVRMGEPAIPPELLVATLREQLAKQLTKTYEQEQMAQAERIKTERERATADKQNILVQAEIDKRAAEHHKEQMRLQGEGEKLRLLQIVQGQKAQVEVLGQDRVLQLEMLKEILKAASANPDIVKVPQVLVSGTTGGSLEGAAAILGASNLVQTLQQAAPEKLSQPSQQ